MESTIVITLAPDGQLGLKANGPAASSKVLMLGMIELAKAAMIGPQQPPAGPATPPILLARGSIPSNGR